MIGDRVYDPISNTMGKIHSDVDGWYIVNTENDSYRCHGSGVVNVDEVLRTVKDGKRCAGLVDLYELPLRDLINWLEFPTWSRPNCETELAHE